LIADFIDGVEQIAAFEKLKDLRVVSEAVCMLLSIEKLTRMPIDHVSTPKPHGTLISISGARYVSGIDQSW